MATKKDALDIGKDFWEALWDFGFYRKEAREAGIRMSVRPAGDSGRARWDFYLDGDYIPLADATPQVAAALMAGLILGRVDYPLA